MSGERYMQLIDESEAVNHQYLQKAEAGEFTPEQMRKEVLERYLASLYTFVSFMATILSKINPLDRNLLQVRHMLAENIYEETGSKDPEKAHIKNWHKLLKALGFTQEEIDQAAEQPSEATLKFAEGFLNIANQESTPFALGAFAYAYEYFVVSEYKKLLEGCKKVLPDLTNSDLAHLISHVKHDPKHAEQAQEVIDLYDTPDEQEQVRLGILAGLAIRCDYYNSRLQAVMQANQ